MKRWHWRALGWVCLLSGLALIGVWGVRVYRSAQALLVQAEALATLLEGRPAEMEVAAVEQGLHDLRGRLDDFEGRVGSLPRLGPAVAWVPRAGGLLEAAPALLDLADAMTDMGLVLIDDVVAAQARLDDGAALREVVVETVAAVQPQLPAVRDLLARAEAAHGQVNLARLPRRLVDPVERVGKALELGERGVAWMEAAPGILGLQRAQTYLILLLNEDELRPGGGFITAVAQVRVVNGAVISAEVGDSYAADDFTLPYPEPPAALKQFLGVDLWVFRDSNWSPDFPTSVAEALLLYHPEISVGVDGVIALDQHAVRRLVDEIGPIDVPGVDRSLDGTGVFELIYATWAPADGVFDRTWWEQRKAILGPLASALLQRVMTGDLDWEAVARAGLTLAGERHIQCYAEDGRVQALLAAEGLDGAVRTAPDFLMVAEGNVGFNKASGRIERSYTYAVDLSQPEPAASLTLTYTHTGDAGAACVPEASYAPQYTDMMERCYWAALQVLVPAQSELRSGSRHPIPGAQVASGEPWPGDPAQALPTIAGTETFVQAFLLPPSEQVVVLLQYALPAGVEVELPTGEWEYRLRWQKQPGTGSIPVRVTLRLPANAVLSSVTPQAVVHEGGVLVCETALSSDLNLTVRYAILEETAP